VSRIFAFRLSDSKIATVAEFNKEYFATGAAKFMTIDEESSGIIDATSLFARNGDTNSYYLFNTQVHTTGVMTARPDIAWKSKANKAAADKSAVEGGAYYLMTISNWDDVFK
jgi:hypothetical protein